MLRKLTLGLVTAVSLSAMALAPTAASAHGFGFGVNVVGADYADDGCYVTRPVLTPFGYRLRTINICGY